MPANRQPPERGYLSMQELSDYLNIPWETLRYWRKLGRGPKGVLLGRRVRYSWPAIRAWEQAMEAEADRQ